MLVEITPHQLQGVISKLMGELVTALHMYSAAHEVLSPTGFEKLYTCSEKCRIKTLFELDRIAMLLFSKPMTLIFSASDLESRAESVPLQKSMYEIYVTERDVDQRITADYDRILNHCRYSASSGGVWVIGQGVAGKYAGCDTCRIRRLKVRPQLRLY